MKLKILPYQTKKSVVEYYDKESIYALLCPTLRVHKEAMMKKRVENYLGNILSTEGGFNDTIEDIRSKGWGKIVSFMGVLSGVDIGVHK